MTTPRDALAAALHTVPDETGMVASPDGAREDADAILTALAAEGWVLVPDPAPLDEAVAAERARIRSGLSALIVHGGYTRMDDEPHYLDRDAVLALLDPQP